MRVGIEPTNKGFADPCLTTWLPHHVVVYLKLTRARGGSQIFHRSGFRGIGDFPAVQDAGEVAVLGEGAVLGRCYLDDARAGLLLDQDRVPAARNSCEERRTRRFP